MNQINYASKISKSFRSDLERLLFFNPLQARYSRGIDKAVDKYGPPRVEESAGLLKVSVGDLQDIQCLFAFDDEPETASLLGVILYYRINVEEILVIHVAVDENCSAPGEFSDELVVLRMFQKLKNDMQKVRGVKRVLISYDSRFDNVFQANL